MQAKINSVNQKTQFLTYWILDAYFNLLRFNQLLILKKFNLTD
jgi:hypothetical protein